jgi:hypothetical protein
MTAPDEIVKNVCYVTMSAMNRIGAAVNDYPWFEQLGIEWIREVARAKTALPCLKVKHLSVPLTKQINLPKDCLRYTKIAVAYRGQLWTLTLDDNIMVPPDMDYSSLENVQSNDYSNTSQGVTFAPHWWQGSYNNGLFGIGGGFNDTYYRVNWTDRTITFLGDFTTNKVVIEYISDGSDITSESLVPQLWIDAMRNYIIWMATKYRTKMYPVNGSPEMDYTSSLLEAQLASGPTVEEMMDAYYKGCGLKLR